MILPTDAHDQQPLCGSGIASGSSSDKFWLLPLRSGVPPILGVAARLSPRAKLVFVATNLPYFAASALIYSLHPILWDRPTGPLCCITVCASAAFHGSVIAALGGVSAYWHGAQCQMQCLPCCKWLYCYSEATGASLLHSAKWLKRLVVADVGCSALTVLVGCVCFGPSRTFSWLAVPLVFFLIGLIAKRRANFGLYALMHGIWHCASAAAIGFIVLYADLPPYFIAVGARR